MEEEKYCNGCSSYKTLDNFGKDKQKADGLRPECKTCKSKRDSIYRQNNKKKIKKIQKIYYDKNAGKIKHRSRVWYKNNLVKAKKSRRTWYDNNQDKVNALRAKHLAENKEFYKIYQRIYQRNRYRTNINCRVKACLNKRLRDYVKDKNLPTMEYLGIPMEEFLAWIEYQFEDGMSWKNIGKKGWSFDHVIPCDYFDLSKEKDIFECYNWMNLRPCWCPENSSKGNKIIPNLIYLQVERVDEFIEERYCF